MTTKQASQEYRNQAEAAQAELERLQRQAQEAAHQAHQMHPRAARLMGPTEWPLQSGDSRQIDVRRDVLLKQLKSEISPDLLQKFNRAKDALRHTAAEARGLEQQRPPLTDDVTVLADWRTSQNDRLHLARTRLETAQELFDNLAATIQAELERKRQAHIDAINRQGEHLTREYNEWGNAMLAEMNRRATVFDETFGRLQEEKSAWADLVPQVQNL